MALSRPNFLYGDSSDYDGGWTPPAGSLIEPGTHSFTGLPYDESGWTDFEEMTSSGYTDARVMFVSNAGNDTTGQVYGINDVTFDTDGMFQASGTINPYATISAANAQMRTGYPDILLLNRGDTWSERFSLTSAGRVYSGRSQTERKIVASYGTGDRPALYNNSGTVFDNDSANYIAVFGLRMYADDWTTSDRAFDIRGYSVDVLIEDVLVENHVNIIAGGDLYRIGFRRCLFTGGEAHDGQFYMTHATDVLLEENLFHSPFQYSYPDESRYGRFLYCSAGNGVDVNSLFGLVLRRNIFNRGERESVDIRSGGLLENNLFVENDLVTFGGRGGSTDSVVAGEINDNVFCEGTPNLNKSNYLDVINPEGVEINRNIWTDPTNTDIANLIRLIGSDTVSVIRGLAVTSNLIYGYHISGTVTRGLDISSSFTEVSNFAISSNEFQFVTGSTNIVLHRDWTGGTGDRFSGVTYSSNKYYSTSSESDWFVPGSSFAEWVSLSGETGAESGVVSYSDSSRTVKTYNQSIGGTASTTDFISSALAQARHNWSSSYMASAVNDYIRAGFDRTAVSVTY